MVKNGRKAIVHRVFLSYIAPMRIVSFSLLSFLYAVAGRAGEGTVNLNPSMCSLLLQPRKTIAVHLMQEADMSRVPGYREVVDLNGQDFLAVTEDGHLIKQSFAGQTYMGMTLPRTSTGQFFISGGMWSGEHTFALGKSGNHYYQFDEQLQAVVGHTLDPLTLKLIESKPLFQIMSHKQNPLPFTRTLQVNDLETVAFVEVQETQFWGWQIVDLQTGKIRYQELLRVPMNYASNGFELLPQGEQAVRYRYRDKSEWETEIIDLKTGTSSLVKKPKGFDFKTKQNVSRPEVNPDGTRIYSYIADEKTIVVWSVADGKVLAVHDTIREGDHLVNWGPNSNVLVFKKSNYESTEEPDFFIVRKLQGGKAVPLFVKGPVKKNTSAYIHFSKDFSSMYYQHGAEITVWPLTDHERDLLKTP